jgi:methionyl-tRNA synthetase
MSDNCAEPELVQSFIDAGDEIAALYEAREFNRAMREIIALADRANQYIDDKKPWVMAKDEALEDEVQAGLLCRYQSVPRAGHISEARAARDGREIRGFPAVLPRLDGP